MLLKESQLIFDIQAIGNEISTDFKIEIIKFETEMIAIGEDCWMNIDFFVRLEDPNILSKMNIKLSERLSEFKCFLHSDIEYIPSFISEI